MKNRRPKSRSITIKLLLLLKNQSVVKNNTVDFWELLFLRKDNIAYFVDTNEKPLDYGSQKLFERNEIPSLGVNPKSSQSYKIQKALS